MGSPQVVFDPRQERVDDWDHAISSVRGRAAVDLPRRRQIESYPIALRVMNAPSTFRFPDL